MNVTIQPTLLKGSIDSISSKSLSHRYVVAAGLARGTSIIQEVLDCDDLIATKEALKHFGVSFDRDRITGSSWEYDGQPIDCNESGSTLRFLIPLAMLQDQEVLFKGRGNLANRPLDVYHELFTPMGISMISHGQGFLPLSIKGKLKGGHFHIQSNISSQFITGLLFSLPLLEKDSIIHFNEIPVSKGYIDLTMDVLMKFGIDIKRIDQGYFIPGNQVYKPLNAVVEGDYSQAAFWMVAGLIAGDIRINKLNPLSIQGDQQIVDIIKSMQGSITFDENHQGYQIKRSETKATTIDLKDIPDLGPILMVLASLSLGTTHMINVDRLIIKESNRLEAMIHALTKLGINIKSGHNEIWIKGQQSFIGDVTLSGASDHRIVMALSIAALRARGPITITDCEAINKSYPTFFGDFRHLGGIVHESK